MPGARSTKLIRFSGILVSSYFAATCVVPGFEIDATLGVGSGGAGGSGGPAQSGSSGSASSDAGAPAGGAADSGGASPGTSAGAAGAAASGAGNLGGNAGSGNAGSGNAGTNSGNMGGSAGSAGTAGTSEGGAGGTEGATDSCPSNAFFCEGFEQAGMPVGAGFKPGYLEASWETYMTLQTEQFHSGTRALEVPPNAQYWRTLSWSVPQSAFWARVYVRSSLDWGQLEHNAFLVATTGDGEPLIGSYVEVGEQFCQVMLNYNDMLAPTIGGTFACGSGVPPLVKDAWHCVEGFFDGPNGAYEIYADGELILEKQGWPALELTSFGLGFIKFHGPERTVYYDDLAVGPARLGCVD